MTRSRRAGALVVLAGILGSVLAACGGGQAASLARKACIEVQHSIATYEQSLHAADPTTARSLAARATEELRSAVQPAALAGSADGDWQALEITLSESNRVPESDLISALTAQCAPALGGNS